MRERKKKVMLVFGTRPEAIKMCPLVKELQTRAGVQVLVCVTGQHREMLNQVLKVFEIVPDFDLSIMRGNQTLFDITTLVLEGMKEILEKTSNKIAFERVYLVDLKRRNCHEKSIVFCLYFNSIGFFGWYCYR